MQKIYTNKKECVYGILHNEKRSISEISKATGISRSQLTKWKKGADVEVRVDSIFKLTDHLGYSVSFQSDQIVVTTEDKTNQGEEGQMTNKLLYEHIDLLKDKVSNQDAIIFAGYDSSPASFPQATEEWSFPSAPGVQLGQLWYNTASTTYKAHVAQGTGAWASGANLNTARRMLNNSGSSQDSILAICGYLTGSQSDAVESYDGSSWSEITELNTDRFDSGSSGPSNTDTLCFGGFSNDLPGQTDNTEKWNGSSWTELGDINTNRSRTVGRGTTTASLMFGGGAPSDSAVTESWNGSSWTEVSDLNTARQALGGAGTQTSALAFGGESPYDNKTESWNGSTWTETGDLNDARSFLGGAGGSNTSALAFGGDSPGATSNTAQWNGSSWTEVAELGTARQSGGSGGSMVAGVFFGGYTGTAVSAATEEWTIAAGTKTLSVA